MTNSANSRKNAALLATLLFVCAGIAGLFAPSAHSQQADRAKQIGGKFMCMCGCNQVLTQCNHVGCTVSASMLKELDQSVARGDSEQSITQAFVQEFGTTVYAEPPKSGLSLVAWVMPSVYLLLGTGLVIFVISRWRQRNIALLSAHGAGGGASVSPELLARARAQSAEDAKD
jgi:cytochrome c-type biogenesis protein CcmH/NrfF